MRVDLHNHTSRCNHATGTVDEYVQKAIELGIEVYGFSEHAPLNFDQHYRLKFEELYAYQKDILEAKKKYKKEIEILLALEIDYLPSYEDSRVFDFEVDYRIGSIHYLDNWGFDNPEFIGEYAHRDIDKVWQEYFMSIEAMAKSGKFDVVGHFDLIKVFKFMPKKDILFLASAALKAIKKSNMVLEINSAGLRKPISEPYPSLLLLQEAFSLDIPITFSSDAHSVEQVGFGYEEICAMAKGVGYKEVAIFSRRDRQMVSF